MHLEALGCLAQFEHEQGALRDPALPRAGVIEHAEHLGLEPGLGLMLWFGLCIGLGSGFMPILVPTMGRKRVRLQS